MHSRETRQIAEWPRFYGAQYAIPLANLITIPLFFWARAEVQRFGGSPFSTNRLRAILATPRSSLASFYKFAGVVVTVFLGLTYLLLGPVTSLFPDEGAVASVVTAILLLLVGLVPTYRRFAPQGQKENIDIALRDVLIRLTSVLGLATSGLVLLLFLSFTIGILIAAVLSVFVPDSVAGELLVYFFAPLLLIPVAATFVLVLRLLPWFKAIPVALSELSSAVIDFVREALLSDSSETTAETSSDTGAEYLPTAGFAHTSVEVRTEEELDTDGYFGYQPSQLAEIETTTVPSSLRYGVLLVVPGFIYAAVSFVFYALRPERTAELAAVVPGENVLVAGLSFVGLPRFVVTNAIELAGLPPETISLGLVGVILPALLMIPGAWHLALEYEKRTYRSLQWLGNDNHLLLLWVLPFVLPFVWALLRVRRAIRARRSGE